MATTAGFKQQCPSCEAWVPVRDAGLIGKKIDCPKCKYRFVVEDPGQEAEVEDEEEEERPAKASKRSRRDEEDEEEAPRSSKAKAGPRRGEDEEEEEDEGKKGGKGVSSKLLLGIGLGVVALGLLGAVGYFIFAGDKPAAPKTTPVASAPTPPPQAEAPKETKPATGSAVSFDAATNLLPGNVEGLCNLRMADLPATGLGRTMFTSPGALQYQIFKQQLGLSLENVDLVLQAWNFTQNWSFNIVHSSQPIDQTAVKAALRLTPAPKKVLEQEYFLLPPNPWLDELGRQTFAILVQINPRDVPVATRPLALRFHDPRTLVIANVNQLEEFLKVKGKFQTQSQAPSASSSAGASKAGANPAGRQGNLMSSGKAGTPDPKGAPGSTKGEETGPPAASGLYLTIAPKLKKMMDRVDTRKPTLSMALDVQAATTGHVPPLGLDTLSLRQHLIKDGDYIGLALNVKDQLSLMLAVDFPAEEIANERMEAYRKEVGLALAKRLGLEFKVKVEMVGAETKPDEPPARSGTPPPRGGFMSPVTPSAGGAPRPSQPPPPDEVTGRPGTGSKPEKEVKVSRVEVHVVEKTVVLMEIKLVDQAANFTWITGRLRQLILQQKGILDMASRRLRIFELARGLHAYLDAHQGEFPRGALERQLPNTRAGRPYAPEQRLSWMVDLLPNLGPSAAALNGRIDRQKSWRDKENLGAAGTLIPEFINPQNPPEAWWIRYPGMTDEVASTSYLGVAGVGLDAADYVTDDQAVTGKLGIFGYERTTKITDITDGPPNTIAIIQVPPNFKRAWMAGGGCTVAGVPEKDSIKPFISTSYKGKRGTLAIMADCSVRFIPETISDEAFKALCTIKGGESVIIDRDAIKITEPEEGADLQIEAISALTPPQVPTTPGRSAP